MSANQFRKGDPIGKKGSRPTNMEREQNMGMFGRGLGDFDKGGNMKGGPAMFDQSPPAGVSPGTGKKKH